MADVRIQEEGSPLRGRVPVERSVVWIPVTRDVLQRCIYWWAPWGWASVGAVNPEMKLRKRLQ